MGLLTRFEDRLNKKAVQKHRLFLWKMFFVLLQNLVSGIVVLVAFVGEKDEIKNGKVDIFGCLKFVDFSLI